MAAGKVIDAYRLQSHYLPSHNVIAVGATSATATPTNTPKTTPTSAQTPMSVPVTPTARSTFAIGQGAPVALATTTPVPTATATTVGPVRVPNLVGLPVAQAQASITQSGLANTYVNYQGSADLPASAVKSIAIGAVLSQVPAPGGVVAKGTTIYLAARKS